MVRSSGGSNHMNLKSLSLNKLELRVLNNLKRCYWGLIQQSRTADKSGSTSNSRSERCGAKGN